MLVGLLLAAICFCAAASAAPARPTAPQFQDGDVVALMGDSITHGRKWHRYVYEYYLTRFPERHIRFVNEGIAGDSAGGGLHRLGWDVLPEHPNAASIMFGMNDIGRGYYGQAKPGAEVLAGRRKALDSYHRNMDELARELLAHGCRKLIFVTPSPYDDTAKLPEQNFFGCNAALAQCGEYGKELAGKYHSGVVDLGGPMTALNLKRQQADPAFTLIGPDRVHPGEIGMLVIAYYYLRAQGVSAVVSRFAIEGDTVTAAVNGEITALRHTDTGVAFDCTERSLPWPLDPGAKGALALVPLERMLNRQLLSVALPDGKYKLLIDGQAVGQYTARALKAGINLARNERTPQYQQAWQVYLTNEKRSDIEVKLRTYAQIGSLLVSEKVKEDDPAAVDAYFKSFLARVGESMSSYFSNQFKVYRTTRPVLGDIRQQIETLQQQLWKQNQPRPHHYELAKVV